MQRVVALLLLCLFSFALTGPVAFAGPDSKLPACCRKGGKHQCGMDRQRSHSGAAFQSVQMKCPLFLQTGAAPIFGKAWIPSPAGAYFAAVLSHPSVHAQTEAQCRISFSRAWQKRGPPALLA